MLQTASLPPATNFLRRPGRFSAPLTILTIMRQMRFERYLSSATTMVGAPLKHIIYRHPDHSPNQECRGCRSEFVDGQVLYSVGVEFPVNGKPGEDWRMAVAYEGDDTYAVWLWGGPEVGLIAHERGVYNSDLYRTVVGLYDEAIKERNGGFIPLG